MELPDPVSASEDFSAFGPALGAPSVFWFVGGTDSSAFAAAMKAGTLDALPINHSPSFAPVLQPTRRTGIEAMLTSAGVWLGPEAS